MADDAGGDKGGESRADKLEARLDKLLADPQSRTRDIGTVMRCLLNIKSLELLERQIQIAEKKLLGKDGEFSLADAVADAEAKASRRKRERKRPDRQSAG